MKLFFLSLIVCLWSWAGASAAPAGPAADIFAAWQAGRPLPRVTAQRQIYAEAEAYRIQKQYLALRLQTDAPAGFIAGLTSVAAQREMCTATPIAGVLTGDGKTDPDAVFPRRTGQTLKVELAFIAGKPITRQFRNVAELKDYISAVAPAVVFTSPVFAGPGRPLGVDLIAAGLPADRFVLAAPVPATDAALKERVLKLYRDGRLLARGEGRAAGGDPWYAALWLVNKVIRGGWTIAPGQLLLTGPVIGPVNDPVDAAAGRYRVDCGYLGAFSFTIRE